MARLKKQVALTLDPAFLARIDAVRGDVSRNRFIERALEAALEDEREADAFRSPISYDERPSERPAVPPGVEMAQRRVSGHVRPPIPKKGS